MRKGWVIALVTAALVFGVTVGASADSIRKSITVDYSGIKLKVNGKTVNTEKSEPFLVVDEGRTYVPARYLAEALGAKVDFDKAGNAVTVITPKYVEPVTEGDVTTYKVPFYGASIKAPAGMQVLPDQANLLNVAALDLNMVLSRVDAVPMVPFDTMASTMVLGMKATSMFTVTAQKDVQVAGASGARDYTGTMTVAGTTRPAVARLVLQNGGRDLWIMMVVWDTKTDADGSKAAGWLNTFTLPQ